VRAAIISVKGIRLAVVLVDAEATYPAAAQAVLRCAEQVFPSLPIVLVSPRVNGFSRNYATFNIDSLIGDINADLIRWHDYKVPEPDARSLPF
jgi:hypothetical protein